MDGRRWGLLRPIGILSDTGGRTRAWAGVGGGECQPGLPARPYVRRGGRGRRGLRGPSRSRYVRDAPAHGRLARQPEYLTRRQERPGRHASRRMMDTILEAVPCSLTPTASPFRTCQRPPSPAVPSIPPRPPPSQVSPLALSTGQPPTRQRHRAWVASVRRPSTPPLVGKSTSNKAGEGKHPPMRHAVGNTTWSTNRGEVVPLARVTREGRADCWRWHTTPHPGTSPLPLPSTGKAASS